MSAATALGAGIKEATVAKREARAKEMSAATALGAEIKEGVAAKAGVRTTERRPDSSRPITEEVTVVKSEIVTIGVSVTIGASDQSLSMRERTGTESIETRGQSTTRWTSTRRSDISTRSVSVTRRSSDITATR